MFGAGLKAGLIIGVILLVLFAVQFGVGLISPDLAFFFGCFVLLLTLVLFFIGGIMAARFAGRSAPGAGAIAGLVAAVIAGLGSMVLAVIQVTVNAQQFTVFFTPETLRALEEAGVSPEAFAFIAGVGGTFFICCILGPIVAAILGAIGGLFGARPKQQQAGSQS